MGRFAVLSSEPFTKTVLLKLFLEALETNTLVVSYDCH